MLVYKATEVVNFAQGDLMMLGGFFAFTFIGILGLNYWIGFAGAVIGDGAVRHAGRARGGAPDPRLSAILHHHGDDRAWLFPALDRRHRSGAPTTSRSRRRSARACCGSAALVLAYDKLSVIAATIILCALLYLFFNRTTLGTAMRASSENMLAAYYMGIPVKRVVSIVWAISAAVATCGRRAAGADHLHSFQCRPGAGAEGVSGRRARRLRLDSGAVVGGVLIGVIESMAGFYLPQGWKDVAPYIVLLVVLLLKPEGLFGLHMRKKV